MTSNWLTLTRDTVWPWSSPSLGLPALMLVAGALVALTVWTYRGVQGASPRRVMTVLGLRLGALAMACLMVLRPSLAFRNELGEPSILFVVLDQSQSMSIQDEPGPKSRWESMVQILEKCEPNFQRLRDTHNISIVVYRFAEDAVRGEAENPVAEGRPDGKRTDFGKMLHTIYENHAADRNLRGLIILSDGADNGTNFQPFAEAAKLRKLPCPIHTFALGKTTTASEQNDIAFTAIKAEPAPVPVKGKLTVVGTLDAPGFVNATPMVRLFIDDKEVAAQKVTLSNISGNEVKLITDAPERPGEIKVTLKVDPQKGELVTENNEISTFVTVIKEGLTVLLVDKVRFPEPQLICDALRDYRSIRLYPAWLRTDTPSLEEESLFEFGKRHYDVIIVGDLSAKRLTGGNPQVLEEIAKAVKDKGTGLLMMGGHQSFGNSDWQETPIADLLPVKLDVAGQVDDQVLWALEPTAKGLGHYVMRLASKPEANRDLWGRLPKLTGYTRLGPVKAGTTVLAVRAGTEEPMLVGMEYGKGRTLAFAGDTTWRWERLGQPKSTEGVEAHAHFWKQIVYWLAHQDKGEGNIQVKLDSRRLPTGGKADFTVEMVGKDGELIPDSRSPRFQVTVKDPQNQEIPVPTAREEGNVRGHFWKTDLPGEYQLVVQGWYKDADGKEISGGDPAMTRFLVYQDNTELLVRAANHDFLTKLASAGGGKFHKAEDLPMFLKDLEKLPLPQAKSKAELWPDWRRHTLSGFLVWFFLMFVAFLSLEWFLRRQWGMV
jgi:uncharacterized membrane protein